MTGANWNKLAAVTDEWRGLGEAFSSNGCHWWWWGGWSYSLSRDLITLVTGVEVVNTVLSVICFPSRILFRNLNVERVRCVFPLTMLILGTILSVPIWLMKYLLLSQLFSIAIRGPQTSFSVLRIHSWVRSIFLNENSFLFTFWRAVI